MQQLGLTFSTSRRGGPRAGAGRKRGRVRHTPHRARTKHQAAHPVHVTLRAFLSSLRSQRIAITILRALRDSRRDTFRVAHYSIQDNHVHLIVEAENKRALSSGVRGLSIRVARRINSLLGRSGAFWADRWHGHALKTPREVRGFSTSCTSSRVQPYSDVLAWVNVRTRRQRSLCDGLVGTGTVISGVDRSLGSLFRGWLQASLWRAPLCLRTRHTRPGLSTPFSEEDWKPVIGLSARGAICANR